MLSLTGCQTSTQAAAKDLVMAQAWRMDESHQATLADAQAATDWQPLLGWKSWGYGPETIWIKTQLRAAEKPEHTPWVVRIQQPTLDYITLYDPNTGLVLRTGDAEPPSHDMSSNIFSLQIPPLPYERTIYLQIRSTSARTVKVEVFPYAIAQQQNRLQEWITGFLIAVSAVAGFWTFVQWWMTGERVVGAFALKQLVTTFTFCFVFGFARIAMGQWMYEGVLSTVTSTLLAGAVSTTVWFFYTLLKGYQPHRWLLFGLMALCAVTAFLPIWIWLKHTALPMKLLQVFVLIALFLLIATLVSALSKKVKQPIPSNVLFFYLCIYCLFNALAPLMNLGWIQASSVVFFGNLAYIILDGLVMLLFLQIRAQNMQKEQQKIASDFQKSLETIALEKRHREEQSQLFAMLAHEMKTPLSTLRMWMEAEELTPEAMERAIADMNSVIERCVHTGQLADQGLQPNSQQVDAAELTRSVIQSCRAPDQVDFAAPGKQAVLHSDAQMLSIVLGNLLDNACKYAAPQSRIRVSLAPAVQDGRAGWCWQVSNLAGPAGLPDADRLFEKYYRSPRAQSLSGSGLGLFLVKGLLALLEGTIHYEARQEQAIFSVWLPSAPSAS